MFVSLIDISFSEIRVTCSRRKTNFFYERAMHSARKRKRIAGQPAQQSEQSPQHLHSQRTCPMPAYRCRQPCRCLLVLPATTPWRWATRGLHALGAAVAAGADQPPGGSRTSRRAHPSLSRRLPLETTAPVTASRCSCGYATKTCFVRPSGTSKTLCIDSNQSVQLILKRLRCG